MEVAPGPPCSHKTTGAVSGLCCNTQTITFKQF